MLLKTSNADIRTANQLSSHTTWNTFSKGIDKIVSSSLDIVKLPEPNTPERYQQLDSQNFILVLFCVLALTMLIVQHIPTCIGLSLNPTERAKLQQRYDLNYQRNKTTLQLCGISGAMLLSLTGYGDWRNADTIVFTHLGRIGLFIRFSSGFHH